MPVQLPPTSRPASCHFLSGSTEAGSVKPGNVIEVASRRNPWGRFQATSQHELILCDRRGDYRRVALVTSVPVSADQVRRAAAVAHFEGYPRIAQRVRRRRLDVGGLGAVAAHLQWQVDRGPGPCPLRGSR
jgi:hypothetical protein